MTERKPHGGYLAPNQHPTPFEFLPSQTLPGRYPPDFWRWDRQFLRTYDFARPKPPKTDQHDVLLEMQVMVIYAYSMQSVLKKISDKQYETLLELCRKHGGELLSGHFRTDRKIHIRCAEGHTWFPDIYNSLKGAWCNDPECVSKSISKGKVAPIIEKNREKLLQTITARGGEWLAGDYLNNYTPVKIRCSNGHVFDGIPFSLFAGQWCGRCAGRYPPEEALARLSKLASSKGGRLISTEFKGVKTKLQFQCGKGHEPWWAIPDAVLRKNGTWCPRCAPKGVQLDLDELKAEMEGLAALKGGTLLSLAKTNGQRNYKAEMQCSAGHVWQPRVEHLRNGSWCNVCNSPGVREKICRAVFEWVTGLPFGKKRPPWLRNARGRQMELDGYNIELGIAFEYQGQQHSEYVPFFHRYEKEFEWRVEDDARKADLCAQNGVELLVIDISTPEENLQSHITELLIRSRPGLDNSLNRLPFDIYSVDAGKEQELSRIKKIALAQGGVCTSTHYVANNRKLWFRCAQGHVWDAVPSSIFSGTWCKECAPEKISATKRSKRDIVPYLKIIEQHQGRLVEELSGSRWEFRVVCRAGHEWITDTARLRNGNWCRKCRSLSRKR